MDGVSVVVCVEVCVESGVVRLRCNSGWTSLQCGCRNSSEISFHSSLFLPSQRLCCISFLGGLEELVRLLCFHISRQNRQR